MNVSICFFYYTLLTAIFALSLANISAPNIFIGTENYEKIRKIFHKTSIVTVLLKNYEQREDIVKWLEERVFGTKNKSFVIYNFLTLKKHEDWIENCIEYLQDPSRKTTYYERMYQKTNPKVHRVPNFHSFDDFESDTDLVMEINVPVMEKNQEKFANGLDKWWKFNYGGYIIFCLLKNLDYYIGCLINRSGTFLIIAEEDIDVQDENFMNTLNETFHKSWKSTNNLKLHILINKRIFHFNPFERTSNETSFGAIKMFENLITEDDVKRINGYPIYVDIFWSAFSVSKDNFTSYDLNSLLGPDIDVTKLIGQQMNATMTVIKNNGKFGGKLPNGTLTGALGSLQKKKADIAMTAFFVKDYDTRAAEFTFPLYMDKLCVVVRKAHRVPPELLPLIIFDESLWIILVMASFMISIVWILLRWINNQFRRPSLASDSVTFNINNYNLSPFLAKQSNLRQGIQIFIDTWMLFLSIPMRRLTRAQYERIFVASVCLVSIIFVSIYQSGLATVFVRPIYFKDIDTLEQLDKSGNLILVKYAGYLTDVFPNDTSQIYRNLRNKMRLIETEKSAMDLVKYQSKVATITRMSTTLLENFLFFVRKELYIIEKECPKNYYLAYMVPTKSTFLPRINEILFDILRFGFIWKWIDDFNYSVEVSHLRKLAMEYNTNNAKVLAMNDLKFPFYILIGGNCLSGIAFISEIIMTVIRRRGVKREKKNKYKINSIKVEN